MCLCILLSTEAVVVCPCFHAVGEGLIVKLADFGLARAVHDDDTYRLNGPAKLPLKWMAPESILYGIFTTQTDTW